MRKERCQQMSAARAELARQRAKEAAGMRRFTASWLGAVSGLRWRVVRSGPPSGRDELRNDALVKILLRKHAKSKGTHDILEMSESEWRGLNIWRLRSSHCVHAGQLCFVPTGEPAQRPAPQAPRGAQNSRAHVRRVLAGMSGIVKRKPKHAARARIAARRTAFENGEVADRRGRWRVSKLLTVKRPAGPGRRLAVLVRWSGNWPVSWVNVTWLSACLRHEARAMETDLFGCPAARRRPRPERQRKQPSRRCCTRDEDDSSEQDEDGALESLGIAPPAGTAARRRRVVDDDDESDASGDDGGSSRASGGERSSGSVDERNGEGSSGDDDVLDGEKAGGSGGESSEADASRDDDEYEYGEPRDNDDEHDGEEIDGVYAYGAADIGRHAKQRRSRSRADSGVAADAQNDEELASPARCRARREVSSDDEEIMEEQSEISVRRKRSPGCRAARIADGVNSPEAKHAHGCDDEAWHDIYGDEDDVCNSEQ